MAELAKKLHFLKSGIEQTAKAYSTTDEVGADYIPSKIDSTDCYIPIVDTTDGRATNGRIIKSGTEYAIATTAFIPYEKIEYTTSGTYIFTAPAGVTTLKVTVAGAGGGGGQYYSYSISGDHGSKTRYVAGGNGGQGELITNTISVTPNSSYQITVGAGGFAGTSKGQSGGNGGTSSVGSLVSARGGEGGKGGARGTEGADGTSYGSGGAGGTRGYKPILSTVKTATAGSPGWIYIEYGSDIQ